MNEKQPETTACANCGVPVEPGRGWQAMLGKYNVGRCCSKRCANARAESAAVLAEGVEFT